MRIQEFDFDIDLLRVLPWHYDSSPNLRQLLTLKSEWYAREHTSFWDEWERNVFNLATANDFGLNIWSIILDLPLYSNEGQVSPADYAAWGFAAFGMNFDNGNFATDKQLSTRLSTEQRRQVLMIRWRNLTSDATMYTINRDMFDLFGSIVYVLDGLNMEISYIFTEPLPDLMMDLFKEHDILPRPSGVKLNILVQPMDVFGFDPFGLNFDQEHSQFGSNQ